MHYLALRIAKSTVNICYCALLSSPNCEKHSKYKLFCICCLNISTFLHKYVCSSYFWPKHIAEYTIIQMFFCSICLPHRLPKHPREIPGIPWTMKHPTDKLYCSPDIIPLGKNIPRIKRYPFPELPLKLWEYRLFHRPQSAYTLCQNPYALKIMEVDPRFL